MFDIIFKLNDMLIGQLIDKMSAHSYGVLSYVICSVNI